MAVLNIHERALDTTETVAGALIDGLSSDEDRLWADGWPAMRFDRPLGVGAVGGHGPIRYTVTHYVPGSWIRFRFTGPRGFHGFHEFAVHTDENGRPVLRHTFVARMRGLARLTWPLAFRPLHDALLEDSLDRAERATAGDVARPARWNQYVRALRWLLGRRGGRRPSPIPS